MQDLPYDTQDRICALATPWSPSALAVIRTTGAGCVDALAPFFSRPAALRSAGGHTAHHGQLVDAQGRVLDDAVVTVFRAPASSTGQETAELSCHGSLPGLRRILDTLLTGGFRAANPGEFTLRAFLNGKLDLTRAEAVQELVAARTDHAQALAYLADTNMRLSHPEAAPPLLAKAIRIDPRIELAHLDLGILDADAGHKEDALRELKIAENLSPNDQNVHWRLARFYQTTGRRDEAKAEFDKTRSLQKAADETIFKKLHETQAKGKPAEETPGLTMAK